MTGRVTFVNDDEASSSSSSHLSESSKRPSQDFSAGKTTGKRRTSWQSAKLLKKRASHMIIEVPVAQLKKIREADGLHSIERETQHFVGITSMHGVLRIYRSVGWIAWFWGFLYGLCGVLLLWQTINLILLYTAKPTVSQVSFLITDHGMLFPKITICNFNPIRNSFIEQINKTGEFSDNLLRYLMQSNADVMSLYGNSDEATLEEGDEELKVYMEAHPEFTINDFFFHAGFSCEDVMKLCTFAGRNFDCCSYSKAILTSLGRCHVLNLRDSPFEWMRRQTEEGIDSGLQIVLDAHLEEQYEGVGEDADPVFSNQFENGFRFYISEPDMSTYKTSQGISVSPADRIYAALSTSRFALLDQANWGNCSSDWPKGYDGVSSTTKYSASDCLSKCKARFFNANCGCSPFVYNIDGEFRSCTPLETYDCTDKYIVFNHNETNEEFRWPSCSECVIECDRWEYSSFNSYGHGFSNGALRWLNMHNPDWTTPHIRANFLTLNIFFRDMTYTEYRQVQSLSVTEILSDFGGNMGMFWGMSVLTCFEAVIYLWKITWIAVSKKRRDYMLSKKRREEEQAKQTEETMKSIRELSASQLAQLAVAQAELESGKWSASSSTDAGPIASVASRFRRWSSQMNSLRRRKMGRVRPGSSLDDVPEETPPTEHKLSVLSRLSSTARNEQKDKFMQRFYSNILHGNGRASIGDGSQSEGSDESVIELKIDLKDLNRRLEDNSLDAEQMPARVVARKKSRKQSRPVSIKRGKRSAPSKSSSRDDDVDNEEEASKRRRRFLSEPPGSASFEATEEEPRRPRFVSFYMDSPPGPTTHDDPTVENVLRMQNRLKEQRSLP